MINTDLYTERETVPDQETKFEKVERILDELLDPEAGWKKVPNFVRNPSDDPFPRSCKQYQRDLGEVDLVVNILEFLGGNVHVEYGVQKDGQPELVNPQTLPSFVHSVTSEGSGRDMKVVLSNGKDNLVLSRNGLKAELVPIAALAA